MVRTCSVLCILTYTCAWRHSGVQIFNLNLKKCSAPVRCFVHFDLQICLAPRPRAIFRHLNFKKHSAPEVYWTFCFQTCFASQQDEIFRHQNFKTCSSHEVFVHFDLDVCFAPHRHAIFVSPLTTWLRTCRFSEPNFRHSGTTNH